MLRESKDESRARNSADLEQTIVQSLVSLGIESIPTSRTSLEIDAFFGLECQALSSSDSAILFKLGFRWVGTFAHSLTELW